MNSKIPGTNVFGYKDSLSTANQHQRCKKLYRSLVETTPLLGEKYIQTAFIPNFEEEPKKLFCQMCSNSFGRERLLYRHIDYCPSNKSVRIKFPKDDNLFFKNHERKVMVTFVAYADFECFRMPIGKILNQPDQIFTVGYQHHIPSGFCLSGFYVKCFDETIGYKSIPYVYSKNSESDDVSLHSVEKIYEITHGIYDEFYCKPWCFRIGIDRLLIRQDMPCVWGRIQLDEPQGAGPLWFRGASHNGCNLPGSYWLSFTICRDTMPIFSWNSWSWPKTQKRGLNVFPTTKKNTFRFPGVWWSVRAWAKMEREKVSNLKSSFKFMASSLDGLVKNLTPEQCANTQRFFRNKFELVFRKGDYPYEYMNSLNRLKEKQLPPKEALYPNWMDYPNLYLQSDVLFLADVWFLTGRPG